MFRRFPLSRKILIGFVPLFLLFVSVSVVLQNRFQEEEMLEQAQSSAHAYAEIIKEAMVSMMVENLEVDEKFLARVNDLPQFDTLHILVNNLRIREELLTPKRVERLATKYRTLSPHDELEAQVLVTGQPVFKRDGDRFRGIVPFNATKVCQECHAVPVGYTLGATDLHVSLEQVSEAAAGNWKRSLVIFLLFIGLAITVAMVIFTRFVAKPVDRLVVATKEISSGNLDYRIPGMGDEGLEAPGEKDELALLAERFDGMRKVLKQKIDQLDEVNKSLSERNVELTEALSRLRQAQEDLMRSERLAVTGKMTAQLSHEINNPIHNIQSLLESSLRKLNGESQAAELVTVALEEVTRMAKLTRQMLDLYRGSVVEVEHDLVNVKDLLVEVVRANEEPLARRGIEIILETQPVVPGVYGSRDKLKQVFLNLILNARDAMPAGGTLTVRTNPQSGLLRISVSDTGIGIPPENLGKIFDAFFTTKKEVSGVGLGLAVTYGIVQQHHGTIEVSSIVNRGTTFTIELPGIDNGNG